eukprot:257301_1
MTESKLNESNEIKRQDEDESSDEETEKETIVNENDLREPVYDLKYKFKNSSVIDCIGKLQAKFINIYNNRYTTVGTGTVFKTTNNTVYVLTCAHNIRLTRYHCTHCKRMNATKKCSGCSSKDNSTQEILKADKVSFEIRDLKSSEQQRKYNCNMHQIEIDDEKYSFAPITSSGYDVCILTFNDEERYFENKCKNTVLVSGKLLYDLKPNNVAIEYCIFGYPYSVSIDDIPIKQEKMWGAVSIKNQFIVEKNTYDKYYLKQYEIDTSKGQSGAAIFALYKHYAFIFAVHTGDSKRSIKPPYNVGTLLYEHTQESKIENLD